jgi:hypothetical protein
MTIPVVMTENGLQPRSAIDILNELISLVAAINPGYTANLPGSLIEDISSTDVGAITLIDQARVDLLNSLTPFGSNEFLLNQLGQVYGVQLGQPTNASVFIQFTGVPGFVVVRGFTVSDGTNQFSVQDGGIIDSIGTVTLFCVALNSGSFPIPANTVTTLVTSVPGILGLSCTNPMAGIQSTALESWDSYRSRVLQAGIASSQGMPSYLRTLLSNVPGVQARLIGILQRSGMWEIICGGGDPFAVGYAIFKALFDVSQLTGSLTTSRNITVAINDFPDTYDIIYINPPLQNVSMLITWNTTLTYFTLDSSVSKQASIALTEYINTLHVGYSMNLFEMQSIFQNSVANLIPKKFLSRLVFQVYINSLLTPVDSGTGLITGDPESYFETATNLITIVRG